MRTIGIDVGGTNTDAVLVEDGRVIAWAKTPTTADVTTGIKSALDRLRADLIPDPPAIDAVMIGTTHFTNAVVERRHLIEVAAIRIGLPATAYLEPSIDWPADLAQAVGAAHYMVEGGHEYDGRPLAAFDTEGVRMAARRIREAGIRSVAVSAVFSPLTARCEEAAARILEAECPGVAVTQSCELGRIGLLARENAALLNATLIELASTTVDAFVSALAESGIDAPLYLTQTTAPSCTRHMLAPIRCCAWPRDQRTACAAPRTSPDSTTRS